MHAPQGVGQFVCITGDGPASLGGPQYTTSHVLLPHSIVEGAPGGIPPHAAMSQRSLHGPLPQTSCVPTQEPLPMQWSSQRYDPLQVNVLPAQVASVHCIEVGPTSA